MKRCPQCSFLYLESDQICDLDQTPLVADHFGTDAGVINSHQKSGKLSLSAAVQQRKLNFKTLLAATVAGLIIGLMLLLSYQRMRPTLRANQAPPISQARASEAARVSQLAQQASDESFAKASQAQQESEFPVEPDDKTSPSAKPSSSTTTKPTPNARPDSARLRVSSQPVSTGDVTKSGRGPVTIRLTNGSNLEADEVWRTKAGIWYRRKGIVTLLKPNRVRAMKH